MRKFIIAAVLAGFAGSAGAAWQAWKDVDEMEGTTRKGMASPFVQSESPLEFPYRGTKGFIGISCEGSGAYMGFTEPPNLSGGTTGSGYNIIHLRVKVGDQKPVRFRATQEWGAKQLHFNSSKLRHLILAGKTMLIEVPWHGSGRTLWRFSLAGTSDLYKQTCPKRAEREARAHAKDTAKRKREAEIGQLIREAGWHCLGGATRVVSSGSVPLYKCDVPPGVHAVACWYNVDASKRTVETQSAGSRKYCQKKD